MAPEIRTVTKRKVMQSSASSCKTRCGEVCRTPIISAIRLLMKRASTTEYSVNLVKLLSHSNNPSRPNLFLAFDRIEMRESFGASLLGAKTQARCAKTARMTAAAGNANNGPRPKAIGNIIPAIGARASSLKNNGARVPA